MRYRDIGSKSVVFVLMATSQSKDRRVEEGKLQRNLFGLGLTKEKHF